MSIAILTVMLGLLPAAAAQDGPNLDELLDGAEKAMQDSADSLQQKQSGRSAERQSDAIQKLEEYGKGYGKNRERANRERPPRITQEDLERLLRDIEQAAKDGDRDKAQRLLDQLAQIMENLQLAESGQGDGDDDMQQAMNELSDLIRKQQQLRDKTYKQGQDSRRDRMRGKQGGEQGGEQGMGDLQQDQQGLRDRLKKLLDDLAKNGMGPGQRGDPGQQGDQGDGEDGLDQADNAMGDATGRLGDGNAEGAVDSQGKALDALRKGAQKLAEAMQQGDGDGQQDGPGNRAGRQQSGGIQTDPLGRPLRGREFSDDYSVKVPGEIDVERVRRILEELRRRLADPSRPQIELDYIERLLKDY